MQTQFSRRVGLQFLAVAFGFLIGACAAVGAGGGSSGPAPEPNQTYYSRVGMRVEPLKKGTGWHMYSTNHIGLEKHLPAGTRFTAQKVGRSKIDLLTEDNTAVQVEFVARHHPGMSFTAWLEQQFSTSPVELPGGLDSSERAAIQAGRYEVGMSRAALFLSVGYPPSKLSPSMNDAMLKYEVKRFNNILFTFDARGKISDIKN